MANKKYDLKPVQEDNPVNLLFKSEFEKLNKRRVKEGMEELTQKEFAVMVIFDKKISDSSKAQKFNMFLRREYMDIPARYLITMVQYLNDYKSVSSTGKIRNGVTIDDFYKGLQADGQFNLGK